MSDEVRDDVPVQELFASGTLLGDRFRIVRPLGEGGMGVVYEAVDEKLDRRVALKCAKAGHQNRLPPEARAAREVSHFNVCKVHDLHTVPTPEGDAALRLLARTEGMVLDPVYTAKAMASLIARVGGGEFSKDQAILFIHTGGQLALFNAAS